MGNHKKLLQFLRPDPASVAPAAKSSSSPSTSSDSDDDDGGGGRYDDDAYSPPTSSPSTSASAVTSAAASPYRMSPWTQLPGLGFADTHDEPATNKQQTGLLGSLVKEDGHVYSLAAAGDLLYTGTDSRNVRVWRDRREMGGFKSGSGLVKAIVVAADGRIFTGHQDGKVRVWRRRENQEDTEADAVVEHRRVGTLPRLRDVVSSSLLPSRYVRTRRRKSQLWLRHFDAVSSLSLDAAAGLLYSGSWDKTVKVWRVSDSRCLESVPAHDDAVNAVAAAGFDALLFTGSADGTVKVWRREEEVVENKKKGGRRRTKHSMERVLRSGDGAVTAIAVAAEARVVYVGSSDGAVTHWQFRRGGNGSVGNSALPPRNGGALRGHKMAVLCLAVAAGRVVVSGSADRTICVWRREEGAEHVRLAVLTGHAGPVKCVAMDEEEDGADGGERRWVVYSGSLDGSVKVWRVSDGGSGAAGAMMTPARTPARVWKGAAAPPSPLSAWTPYAAAPETKRMAAA